MAGTPIMAVGVAWYRRQDYGRILDIMEDAGKLPRSYDQWLEKAEASERKLKGSGHIVVRAIIDPDEFVAWCGACGLNVNSEARTRWGNEAALREVKNSH